MATELKRLTFVVTQEMEPLLANAKKEFYYDRTQSDMIRELLLAGLNAVGDSAAKKNTADLQDQCDEASR